MIRAMETLQDFLLVFACVCVRVRETLPSVYFWSGPKGAGFSGHAGPGFAMASPIESSPAQKMPHACANTSAQNLPPKRQMYCFAVKIFGNKFGQHFWQQVWQQFWPHQLAANLAGIVPAIFGSIFWHQFSFHIIRASFGLACWRVRRCQTRVFIRSSGLGFPFTLSLLRRRCWAVSSPRALPNDTKNELFDGQDVWPTSKQTLQIISTNLLFRNIFSGKSSEKNWQRGLWRPCDMRF